MRMTTCPMVRCEVNPASTPRSIQVEADSPNEAVSTAQDATEASHGSPLGRLDITCLPCSGCAGGLGLLADRAVPGRAVPVLQAALEGTVGGPSTGQLPADSGGTD